MIRASPITRANIQLSSGKVQVKMALVIEKKDDGSCAIKYAGKLLLNIAVTDDRDSVFEKFKNALDAAYNRIRDLEKGAS